MRKPFVEKWDPDTYPFSFELRLTNDAWKEMADVCGDEATMPKGGNGFCWLSEGRRVIYIVLEFQNMNEWLVSHEIQHAVIWYMNFIGAPMNLDTAEQMCYFSCSLSKWLRKTLHTRKVKIEL